MPHIIIEHSERAYNDYEPQALLTSIVQALAETTLFNMDNIKARLHPTHHFWLSEQFDDFVHVQCRIHQGRSTEQKRLLSDSVLNRLSKQCNSKTVITVEIVDMDTESYSKRTVI